MYVGKYFTEQGSFWRRCAKDLQTHIKRFEEGDMGISSTITRQTSDGDRNRLACEKGSLSCLPINRTKFLPIISTTINMPTNVYYFHRMNRKPSSSHKRANYHPSQATHLCRMQDVSQRLLSFQDRNHISQERGISVSSVTYSTTEDPPCMQDRARSLKTKTKTTTTTTTTTTTKTECRTTWCATRRHRHVE